MLSVLTCCVVGLGRRHAAENKKSLQAAEALMNVAYGLGVVPSRLVQERSMSFEPKFSPNWQFAKVQIQMGV